MRGDPDFAPVGSGYLDGTAEVEQYTVETIQGGVRYVIHLWDTPGLTGQLAQSRPHDALSVVHDAFAVLRERGVRRVDGIFVFAKASGRLQARHIMQRCAAWLAGTAMRLLVPSINIHVVATHCPTARDAARTFADLQQHVAWSFLAAVPSARRHFFDLCTRFPATMAKRTRMRCIARLRRNVRDNLLLLMLEPMGSPISVARATGHVGEQIGAAKEPRAQALEGEPVVQHEQEQEEEEQQQQVEQEEEENGDGAALTAPAARESGSRMKLESRDADSGNSSDGGGADQADTHDHGVDNSSNSDADDDDDDDDDDERSDETQNNNEARRDQTEESNNGDDTNNNNNDPDNNSSNDPNNNSSDDTGRQLLCCRRHRAAEGRPHHCHARPVRWRPRAHERQHPP